MESLCKVSIKEHCKITVSVNYSTVTLNLRSFVELVWYRVGMRERGHILRSHRRESYKA
jgi:hypothetical protein